MPERLGGADAVPGALSTLELVRDPDPSTAAPASPSEDLPVPGTATGGDAFSADRFTVDLDEWKPRPGPVAAAPRSFTMDRTSPWWLLGRLVVVVALGLTAFHHSVASVSQSIAGGSVIVYVLAVPLYGGLAAAASARRPRYRVASSVRLSDVVLGSLVCLLALGVTPLVGPGLSGVYGLWRVDLLMLWLFLLGATVLSFGLRQVLRSWPFWVTVLLLWPFPVRLANAAVGGALGGCLLLVLVVLALLAYGHRPDDPPRWHVVGSAAVTAGIVLAFSGVVAHPQRLEWPSVVVVGVAAAWWGGQTHATLDETAVEHRVRGSSAILVGLALVGLVTLPPAPRLPPLTTPTGITALSVGPLEVPGFATIATTVSKEQQRYFGASSSWQRVRLRQGDPRSGPALGGRDMVVDVISTARPQALDLYPVVTTYPMGTLSSAPDAEVDLGHGVTGQLFGAEDSRHHIAYTLLTFSWRLPVDASITGGYTGPPAQLVQRVTLIALDDQREGAPFPEPGNATLDGIKAVLVPAWSGGTGVDRGLGADELLLDDTARALVHQRLTAG